MKSNSKESIFFAITAYYDQHRTVRPNASGVNVEKGIKRWGIKTDVQFFFKSLFITMIAFIIKYFVIKYSKHECRIYFISHMTSNLAIVTS